MSGSPVDYGDDLASGASHDLLATISYLADQQLEAEAAVEAAEEALRRANERLRDISERQLPEAMADAQQREVTTASNVRVKIEDKVRASIPEARRVQGFRWLRENDHGALIKTQLEVPFEAGRDPAAMGLRHLLVLLSVMSGPRETLRDSLLMTLAKEEERDLLKAAFSFLAAVGNDAEQRFVLSSRVHAQSLAALVRELMRDDKIDEATMEVIGAHAWKASSVKRRE